MRELDDARWAAVRAEVARFPRLCGYYLVKLVAMAPGWDKAEEASLDALFQALDDKAWPPAEQRPSDQRWTDYEVLEEDARSQLIEALVAGHAYGHSQVTMPVASAEAIWRNARGVFGADARFFVGLGLGNNAYTFQHGVVIVDVDRAGCLWVVDGD
jgi:hypothetical protein